MQYHALPGESADLLAAIAAARNLHVVVLGGLPFSALEVPPTALRHHLEAAATNDNRRDVFLLCGEPVLGAPSRLKFYDQNGDGIVVAIGPLSSKGLVQSALAVETEDPCLLGIAKELMKRLRKKTKVGVTAVNTETGARAEYKMFRYTAGAEELERGGFRMLPFAGGVALQLGLAK
ncbi:hypothetical protein [Massilia sp. DWR3-1-1]|uniref:hypothetical protein n=1 Tax=Massilia sp. DWR3-1-1 TaxID=2804559 RepID=UPI003CE90D05